MKPDAKDRVRAFAEGELNSRVDHRREGGIGVPMPAEHGSGLGSQLHQLRGRVGRGEASTFCCLLADRPFPKTREDD